MAILKGLIRRMSGSAGDFTFSQVQGRTIVSEKITATSILLIVGGFFCPPMGSIDGSVLTAVGLLILFSFIEKLPEAIAAGRSVKIQRGDTYLEVSGKDSV